MVYTVKREAELYCIYSTARRILNTICLKSIVREIFVGNLAYNSRKKVSSDFNYFFGILFA